MPVTIIAEAGVNHNGDLETAKRMAYVAKECGDWCEGKFFIKKKTLRLI